MSTSSLGQIGETLGCDYLRQHGYTILAINYTNPIGRRLGEIDIIARKKDMLVFVEVKTRTRRHTSDLPPEAAITAQKLHKLNKIAQYYIRSKKLDHLEYHFDALAILIDSSTGKPSISHLQDIFLC